jgi:outer membrane protein assembly factor BamB
MVDAIEEGQRQVICDCWYGMTCWQRIERSGAMQQQAEERRRRDAPKFADTLVVGSRYGTIWMLRAATGEVLWRHVTGERLGSLLSDGANVYVASYFQGTERVREREPEPATPQERLAWARRQRVSHHGTLTALRADDGVMLWQREGWMSPNSRDSMHAALTHGLLVTDVLSSELGRHQVVALDPATGETRWSYNIGGAWGSSMGLRAVCGDYVVVRTADAAHPTRLLDIRTGEEAQRWDDTQSFVLATPRGTLALIGPHTPPAGGLSRRVVRVADGLVVADEPGNSTIYALADEGVAYVALHLPRRWVTAAVRVHDWSELWRNTQIEALRLRSAATGLYHVGLTDQTRLAEVGRLDPQAGSEVWRWHSPGNIFSLLRVWGRRTLDVLIFALAQARRILREARKQRDRSIIMWELRNGKWRHPGRLDYEPRVIFGREHVYVATEMGLYTLRASDGHLLWHALPTRNLSSVAPALPPPIYVDV